MKRLNHYNNDILDLTEYRNYKLDLNWKDTGNDSPDNVGNHTEDPSMNDFIKGYNIDPYEIRVWAKGVNNMKRLQAARTIELYNYDELSQEAQQNALANYKKSLKDTDWEYDTLDMYLNDDDMWSEDYDFLKHKRYEFYWDWNRAWLGAIDGSNKVDLDDIVDFSLDDDYDIDLSIDLETGSLYSQLPSVIELANDLLNYEEGFTDIEEATKEANAVLTAIEKAADKAATMLEEIENKATEIMDDIQYNALDENNHEWDEMFIDDLCSNDVEFYADGTLYK